MSKNFSMDIYLEVLKKLMRQDPALFTGPIGDTELAAIDYAKDRARVVHTDVDAHLAILGATAKQTFKVTKVNSIS